MLGGGGEGEGVRQSGDPGPRGPGARVDGVNPLRESHRSPNIVDFGIIE